MDRQALVRRLEEYRDSGRTWLLEPEACALLADAGMTVPRSCFVRSAAELDAQALADLGAPRVVVKVVSPDILHKSDVGGVETTDASLESVRNCIEAMSAEVARQAPEASIAGYFIVEKVDFVADAPGTELLLSLRRDDAFGPVLTCGPRGLLAEWFGKLSAGRSHATCSAVEFDADAAVAMIAATPFGQQALRPSRRFATAPFSPDALKTALAGLTRLATLRDANDHALIREIEINPVVASGGTPIALDALVRLATEPRDNRLPRPIEKIKPLLHPKSAAIWGASASSMNAGRIILQNLKRAEGLDYGRLYVVHPRAERIDAVKCVASTADLPETVDLAVVSIPASRAASAARAAIAWRTAAVISAPPPGRDPRPASLRSARTSGRGRPVSCTK